MAETWSLSNTQLEKLVTIQRKIEKIMLGVTLKDRKSTNWIRKQNGVADIIRSIRESKHRWSANVARRHDNRWTIRVTEWISRGHKRPRGRPTTRWCDDLIQYVWPTWRHIAKDRKLWKVCREGFLVREREAACLMMMIMISIDHKVMQSDSKKRLEHSKIGQHVLKSHKPKSYEKNHNSRVFVRKILRYTWNFENKSKPHLPQRGL